MFCVHGLGERAQMDQGPPTPQAEKVRAKSLPERSACRMARLAEPATIAFHQPQLWMIGQLLDVVDIDRESFAAVLANHVRRPR